MNNNSLILFGSGNKHKYIECKTILENIPLASLEEYNIQSNAQECGSTFFENAFSKALHYYKAVQDMHKNYVKSILVEDSGICVHALHNRPGIHSARYGMENNVHNQREKHKHWQCIKLQEEMQHIKERSAHFTCCAVLLRNPHEFTSVQTTWYGSIISTAPQGTQGFGYDPIFFVSTENCVSAELEPHKKNAISHRGKALRALLPHIKSALNNIY